MMRVKFYTLIFLLSSFVNADTIISPDNLPPISKEFLQKNFEAKIGLVQKDEKSYEVYLSDGTELEFDSTGVWKEIEAKHKALNHNILPPNIAAVIKNKFKNTAIKELERKINHYKIKFYNDLELIIDFNGGILKQEFDD